MKRKLFIAAALILAANTAQAQFDFKKALGSLSEKAGDAAKVLTGRSEEQEQKLGAQWAATLLGAAPLVSDKGLQTYVNELGLWIALHSERSTLPWKFGVIDSPNINAFATPGGYVLVTRGLLLQLRDEAELAGVLAHEIAHVVKKHHLNAILKAQGAILKAQGAILKAQGASLGAELLGKYADSKLGAGEVTDKVVGGLKEISLRGLDKGDEYQADRMALVLAARAGYDPFGLPRVLQKLETLNAKDSSLALLFETHPTPTARLDALEQSAGEKLDGYAQQPVFAERFAASVQLH
ncbi:MAG: M48 family metalloprotease [Pseudomonadota bacterium]